MSHAARLAALWVGAVFTLSCASLPYAPGTCDPDAVPALRPSETQFERGRPNRFVDGLGHYLFSLPAKLLLLSWSVENHRVSEETERALRTYVDDNGLCHVKIRLNQYRPGGEWSRLFRNREVGGGWRYTLGILSVVSYTVFPQRVFGGDNYNPFTNTVHVYSDVGSIALHEGGHSKDFDGRRYKGTYGALRLLPLVPLFQEAIATRDAVSYLRDRGDAEGERRAYPMLWSAYGTYVAGEGLRWYNGPAAYLIQLPFAWTGRLAGHVRAAFVPDPPEELEPAPGETELDPAPGETELDPAPDASELATPSTDSPRDVEEVRP